MNFKKFKASLAFRKYNNSKIILRFIEYKIKNIFLDLLVNLNIFKFNSKKNNSSINNSFDTQSNTVGLIEELYFGNF